MPTPTGTRRSATGEKPAAVAPNRSNRIRLIAYWVTTFVILAELLAGAAWDLFTIDWMEDQLDHLGYPDYFAYILGVCHVAAAITIAVPGFGLVKEWAYAGVCFMWSGAAVSYLALGDAPVSWAPPLMFVAFAVASWALRPAGRRAGGHATDRPRAHPREWTASIGLLVALSAVSLLTLPITADITSDWAVERGWVDEQRP
ncbi:DoxX family protein [Nocardia cyriacigeorgica]|uniref:DoxX family protein n=1 Tax=Nocardia cyriacigeorgica TaxID=135487 RepID=A0A5R8NDC6_9NOCA|nr:DoxX family protein [Nocardia cyriacigeorgica]TLF73634.1 DoxX family protein [Nocardia cyriacigeorgica]